VTLTRKETREVRAFLRLKRIPKLGDRGIKELVDARGSGVGALGVVGEQLDILEGGSHSTDLSRLLDPGTGVLPMTSPSYPPALLELTDPPPLIFVKGRRELLTGPAVAIVGSRRATEVGRRAAETMARVLAESGVTVVSGMALGIDGAAHRGALAVGGNTLAVLGAGFKVSYPRAHQPLSRKIAERGLLVSEFLPDEQALPHHFPKRNRVIAAFAQAIVVVEAGRKSGALITVDHGLDLGRDILAVPGSVGNPQAAGSNALLGEGARIVPDPARVLDELEGLGWDFDAVRAQQTPSTSSIDVVPAELHTIWTALSDVPRTADEVAREASVRLPEAMAGLSALELGGWARQRPGMRFQRR